MCIRDSLKALLALLPEEVGACGAISMPDTDDPALAQLVAALREAGEIVINCLGADPDPRCDRHLQQHDGAWRIQPVQLPD